MCLNLGQERIGNATASACGRDVHGIEFGPTLVECRKPNAPDRLDTIEGDSPR